MVFGFVDYQVEELWFKIFRKKNKNSIKIEGDTVRKFINYDLGYTKKDHVNCTTNLRIAQLLIHERNFNNIKCIY